MYRLMYNQKVPFRRSTRQSAPATRRPSDRAPGTVPAVQRGAWEFLAVGHSLGFLLAISRSCQGHNVNCRRAGQVFGMDTESSAPAPSRSPLFRLLRLVVSGRAVHSYEHPIHARPIAAIPLIAPAPAVPCEWQASLHRRFHRRMEFSGGTGTRYSAIIGPPPPPPRLFYANCAGRAPSASATPIRGHVALTKHPCCPGTTRPNSVTPKCMVPLDVTACRGIPYKFARIIVRATARFLL